MTRPRLHHVIAACCFCAAMALDLQSPARAQTTPAAVLDNPLAALSLDRLSATREHPLFSPSRRAPQLLMATSVRAPATQTPPSPPKIELHGTIINADDALAIVLSTTDNQTMRVHLGDEIAGWKVIAIDQRKLVLSLEERTTEYTIFTDKNGNDASAPDQGPQRDQTAPSQPRPRASLDPTDVNRQ